MEYIISRGPHRSLLLFQTKGWEKFVEWVNTKISPISPEGRGFYRYVVGMAVPVEMERGNLNWIPLAHKEYMGVDITEDNTYIYTIEEWTEKRKGFLSEFEQELLQHASFIVWNEGSSVE